MSYWLCNRGFYGIIARNVINIAPLESGGFKGVSLNAKIYHEVEDFLKTTQDTAA